MSNFPAFLHLLFIMYSNFLSNCSIYFFFSISLCLPHFLSFSSRNGCVALITLLPTPDGTLLTLGLSGDPAGRCPSHQVFIREFSSSLALAQTPTINIHSTAHFHHPLSQSYYNPSEMLQHIHQLSLTELHSTNDSCLGRHTHTLTCYVFLYACLYILICVWTFVNLLTNSSVK